MIRSIQRRNAFRKNQQSILYLLESVEKLRLKFRTATNDDGRQQPTHQLYTAALLCNLIESAVLLNLDLSVALEDLFGAKQHFRRDFYSRVMAVLAVGLMDQMQSQLGKPCRVLLESVKAPQAVQAEISAVHKELHQLHRRHGKLLRRLRNSTLAHRSKDAEAEIELRRSSEPADMLILGMDLMRWLTRMQKAMNETLNWLDKEMTA